MVIQTQNLVNKKIPQWQVEYCFIIKKVVNTLRILLLVILYQVEMCFSNNKILTLTILKLIMVRMLEIKLQQLGSGWLLTIKLLHKKFLVLLCLIVRCLKAQEQVVTIITLPQLGSKPEALTINTRVMFLYSLLLDKALLSQLTAVRSERLQR